MKILLCHNYYQQPGGEDQVFANEQRLLRRNGDSVATFVRHNDALNEMPKLRAALNTVWNRASYRDLRTAIRRERPDIVHFTNTFPLISPAAYYAARDESVPVVQVLHNYRLLCPCATLLRDEGVCEDCLSRWLAWPGIRHACYRGSRSATTVVAGMLAFHRIIGTWRHLVSRYVVLTEFARCKFIEAGFPADRLVVNPNCVDPDPGMGDGEGGYALFVGRLSPEKGIDVLLRAWQEGNPPWPLRVVGDGPQRDRVHAAAEGTDRIEYLGQRSRGEVLNLIGSAKCIVFPSIWYEGLPMVIIEAFAKGTPVIASRVGAMTAVIQHGRNGLHFERANAADLTRQLALLDDQPGLAMELRRGARATFETHYTADIWYENLQSIYHDVIQSGQTAEEHERFATQEK